MLAIMENDGLKVTVNFTKADPLNCTAMLKISNSISSLGIALV
jgi:hypothetical protein